MNLTLGNKIGGTFAAIVLLLLLNPAAGTSIFGQHAALPPSAGPPANQGSPAARLGTQFEGGAQPVRLHVNQYRNCFAMAPADWAIYGERREGDALDIGSPNMAASWSVLGVPGFMVRMDPYRYGTPEMQIYNSLSLQFRGQPVTYGTPMRDDFGYTWLPYESGDAKGVVIYQVWAIPYDPPGYVVVRRLAQTRKSLWKGHGAEALAGALSIRCVRQLQPSPDAATGSSSEDKLESTYNPQLGMEYAHDSVTGENYWVSPSADWQENGPEGPGYYRRTANELRKLAPGRSE